MVDNTTQQQQQPTNEDANLLAQLSSFARPTNNQHQPGFPTFNNLAFGGGLPPLGSYMGSGGYPGTSPSNHMYGYGPHASHRSNDNSIDTPVGAESEQRKPSGMTPLILASMPTLAQPSFAAGSHHSHHQILQVVSSDSQTDYSATATATDTANPAAIGTAGVAAGTNGEQTSSKKWARWVSRK